MDSSPPLPAHHSLSHPSSPAHSAHNDAQSDYSLDLGALTKDSLSAPPSPPVMRKVDEVRSEDIDGPSDFTLHMEEWMRGTRKGKSKGTLGRGTQRNPFGTMKKGTVKSMFAQPPDSQIEEEDEAVPQQTVEESPSPARQRQVDTPVPDSSLFLEDREGSATPRVNGNSSMLDANVEQAWMKGRQFLQPTVEDYNSELTPGRPLSAPLMSRPSPLAYMDRASSQGPPVPKHSSSDNHDEMDQLRRQLEESRILREKSELRAQHFEDQLRSSNEARKELQNQLDRTTDALRSANEGQSDKASDSTKITALEERLQKSQDETAEVRKELSKAKSLADELRTQLDEMRESEDAELHDLRWRVKSLAEGEKRFTTEAEDLKSKLKTAVDEATRLRTDLDSEKRAKDDLQSRLSIAPSHQSAPTPTISEADLHSLRTQLQSAKDEATSLRARLQQSSLQAPTTTQTDLDAAKQEILHLREELDLLQDLSRLDDDDDRPTQKHARTESTVSTSDEQLRPQLDAAVQKAEHFESMVKEYAAQIASLRSGLLASKDDAEGLRKELDLAHKQTSVPEPNDAELRESERKRLDLHATVDEMRKELDGLRKANEAMDQRVSESLRKREEGWQVKEQEWIRERKTMVKALMRQWGREEVGVDSREQRYRYQFGGRGEVVS
ncbi:hypothetical protein BDZ85DRAFT_29710 [Elsinoe ampelina]|uniref:Uncharacterized protein n=1 Tax=Elsinoe ampelina TaxID=302913 RepID=A0A6A6G4L5_9PEZI|nr:hypothetical protein BDZ85DRAFT_29710 [Elsinoe ampelina]